MKELDRFFARHALENDRAGIGRTFVLRRGGDDRERLPSVLGFYTLSMAVVSPEAMARFTDTRLPRYPMPVALLGRLAIDSRAQGNGHGESLLLDALARIVGASALVGCMGALVDAKNERTRTFYEKYDFVDLAGESWPRRMYLPIARLRSLL